MKKDIHPEYRQVTVVMPDESRHTIWSSYPKEEMAIDVNWRKHPAWTQSADVELSRTNDKVKQFSKRFGDLQLGGESS